GGSGPGGEILALLRQAKARCEGLVELVQPGGVDVAHRLVADRLGCRGANQEAAARPALAGEIDRQRRAVDAAERLAQRVLAAECLGDRRAAERAIALAGL